MIPTLQRALSSKLAFASLLLASSALAQQEIPQGAQAQSKATTGATDVTTDKFQTSEKVTESKDATELSLSAGGLQSTGNARLLALTTATKFRLRRDDQQFRAALAGNYARTTPQNSEISEETVRNLQGLTRYDYFLGDFTLFTAVQGRHDKFQGLAFRLQVDPGVGYTLINKKNQLLMIELGYDLLHDIRLDEARVARDDAKNELRNPDGSRQFVTPKTRTVHSGRVALGYEHALSDTSKLTAGIEFLQGISDTGLYRINGDVALTTKIFDALAISFSFSERYESKPVPGKEKLDTVTSVSLVYTFLLTRPRP
jgi:putative salt-induced outer membrane protein YdiY